MAEILEEYEVQFPTWALCPLFNSDPCECVEEEDMLEKFEQKYQAKCEELGGTHVSYNEVREEDPYYTPYPEFGLPCDCVDLRVIIWA